MLILVGTLSFLGHQAVSYVIATTTDITPPQITSIYLPTMVVPGGYMTVSVIAPDDSSGTKAINIVFESPTGKNTLHKESVSVDSTGKWYANVYVPYGVEAGTWKVRSVYVVDNSGNAKTYFYGSSLTQTFNVSSAGSSQTDTASANSCASFDYSSWSDCSNDLITRRSIIASYPSGCMGGTPLLVSSCGSKSTTPGITPVTCDYSSWSDCSSNGVRTRSILTTPTGCTAGTLSLSETCTPTDNNPPQLTSVTVSPYTVYQNGQFTVRVSATDDLSGVKSAKVRMDGPSETAANEINAEITSMDSTGYWSASLQMPSGAQTGTWTVESVTLTDNSGKTKVYSYGTNITTTFTVAASTPTISTYCNTTDVNTRKYNCTSSTLGAGTWNTSTCTCSCPSGYALGGGGSCVYQTSSTTTVCGSDGSSADCANSKGTWSTTSCACSCPTGYYLSGTKCVTSITTSPTNCSTSTGDNNVRSINCAYSNGSWNSSSCTCTCPANYILGGGGSCVYQTSSTIPATCGTSAGSGDCTNSGGSWSATACACTCPANFHLSGTKCVATTDSTSTTPKDTTTTPAVCNFTYSDWSPCKDGKQSRSISSVLPAGCTGGQQESLLRYCLIDSTCQKDEWTCDTWNSCKDGKQTRTCKLSFDCPGISTIAPKTEQACTAATAENAETVCTYKYSDYGECQNGMQTRKITDKSPAGCVDENTAEPLTRTCTVAPVQCNFTYSAWSDCKNGSKNRDILSKTPEGCVSGTALVEDKCQNVCTDADWNCGDWTSCGSEGTQYRQCAMSTSCISNKNLAAPQTTRGCVYVNPNPVAETPAATTQVKTDEEPLPADCVSSGWTDKKDCELYLYHSRLVSDCRSSGLNTQDQCREYLLSKYGKPLKCQGLSDESCNSLINNVILADMKTVMTAQTQQQLTDVAGMSATIDSQNQTITVDVTKEAEVPTAGQSEPVKETREVKVDNLPIVSTATSQVSVSLLPTEVKTDQQNLSPVAIAFDSDGDGLPDDVEKRLGTDFNKKDTDGDGYSDFQELQAGSDPLDPLSTPLNISGKKTKVTLSGVDSAIVNGKPLEQPKYSVATTGTTLAVSSISTVKPEANKPVSNNLKFEGKAKPNQVITLYIYSTMPIVITVKADGNGNWNYELDKTMVDGTHEVYVAVNNNEGKIVESSLPTPFFIQKAQAVSVDEFVANGDATQIPSQAADMTTLYVLSGVAVILVLIAAFLIIKQRFAE